MATVEARLNSWRVSEVRGEAQVNNNVLVKWYNKGLRIFQKYLLEYASWLLNSAIRVQNITKGENEYSLPLGITNVQDFYSIIQLRVAYKEDKYGKPIYKVCKPISLGDYNIKPNRNVEIDGDIKVQWWQQFWDPIIWNRISMTHPRYVFISKDKIRIFPTPIEDVTGWLNLVYNFMEKEVWLETDESTLNLPWYFFDAIEDYLTYQLYLKENPELADVYLQTFQTTLHDNIYWLNRDQRETEEEFANLSYFYKG